MSAGRRSLLIAMMLATGLMTTNLREARADISRGCAGQMWIFDRARDSSDVQKELLASIEGRGSCNRTEKRKCRKRAADAIIRCAREMWETRNTGVMPVSCVQRRGQSNFARATLEGIFPFLPLGHVLDRGRRAVCCKFNRVASPVPAQLWVVVIGETGCVSKTKAGQFQEQGGSWHSVDENASFNCAAHRARVCR